MLEIVLQYLHVDNWTHAYSSRWDSYKSYQNSWTLPD